MSVDLHCNIVFGGGAVCYCIFSHELFTMATHSYYLLHSDEDGLTLTDILLYYTRIILPTGNHEPFIRKGERLRQPPHSSVILTVFLCNAHRLNEDLLVELHLK